MARDKKMTPPVQQEFLVKVTLYGAEVYGLPSSDHCAHDNYLIWSQGTWLYLEVTIVFMKASL
jgi:hypothetical protein